MSIYHFQILRMFCFNKYFIFFFSFIKKKRPSISPNFNFLGQLLEYEKQIKSSISQSLITKTSPPSNTSIFSNISKPIINSINSTCQTLCTITKTVSSNETGSKSLEINKPKLNLTATATSIKKPFIFNSPPGGALTTDQDLFKVVLQPVFSRASHQQQPALLSPCKALENFNFNSPKVEKSVIELFESSIQSSSSSEDLNSNSIVKFRNIDQDKLKYMPKSFTISDNLSETTGTTNSFKLSLSRKTTTTNYKRTATENLNIIDVEQENCQDNDTNLMSSLSSTIENDKQQQKLTRPSSIFLNRQHLLPIKETNPNIQQLSSFFSSTTSSSSSSSYLQQNNPNDSPQNNEFQFDLNNKKMRLSPINDMNPIHSNSQLLLLQNSIKSKSSENLVKTVNDNFNISSSYNNENYSFHKSQSTNLIRETEAKSTF
jgi:hypothetical protein